MKIGVRGHYYLNKRHRSLSHGWHNNLRHRRYEIDRLGQNNDVMYDNHDVKLLKDKQIIDFSVPYEVYEVDEELDYG